MTWGRLKYLQFISNNFHFSTKKRYILLFFLFTTSLAHSQNSNPILTTSTNDFFSFIGTIASIGSIPLSIYLYIKSKENNIEKIKREIVKSLSFQIGDKRHLSTFEIQTIINSKSREGNIDSRKISINMIIEDIISETITNPLLDKVSKDDIIKNLKEVYYKGEILTSLEKFDFTNLQEGDAMDKEKYKSIEISLRDLISKRIEANSEYSLHREEESKDKGVFSDLFGIIASIFTLFTVILIYFGEDKYVEFNTGVKNFFDKNEFYVGLIFSIIISALSIFLVLAKRRIKK